jgi:ribonuclease HI
VINCFTDGSLNEKGTGSGIYIMNEDSRFSIPLDNHASVFQAECYAINGCAKILTEKNIENKIVNIYSDSQAALKAHKKNLILCQTVKESVLRLSELSLKNTVNLVWIPAHQGFEGNEIADFCAKCAADSNNKPTTPVVRVSKSRISSILTGIFKEKAQNEFSRKAGMTHAKAFIKDYNTRKTKDILNLRRNQMHLISGMLTGHYPLNARLNKMRLIPTEESYCRFCGFEEEEVETARHVLCECVGLERLRVQHFGPSMTNVTPQFIRDAPIKTLLRFLESLRLS